jgi:lipoate synthase
MTLVKSTLKQDLKNIFEKASYEATLAMLEKMRQISLSYDSSGMVSGASAPTNQEIAERFKEVFVENSVDNLADTIDEYIKSATVTVAAAIPVSVTTAGSATNQAGTGATTSTGTGTIS